MKRVVFFLLLIALVTTVLCPPSSAQSTGTVEGVVTLPTNAPIHRASVLLTPLGQFAETDASGRFRFENVPAGTYELAAFRWMLAAEVDGITITGGVTRQVNMRLGPALVAMEMSVGAYGRTAALAGSAPEPPEPPAPAERPEPALAAVTFSMRRSFERQLPPRWATCSILDWVSPGAASEREMHGPSYEDSTATGS